MKYGKKDKVVDIRPEQVQAFRALGYKPMADEPVITTAGYEALLAENQALRAENQALKAQLEKTKKGV